MKKENSKIKGIDHKKRIGLVIKKKMDKTAIVKIIRLREHPYYHKRYKVDRKIACHDEKNITHLGDRVEIEECRPISKTKRWKIVDILK